MKEAEDDENIEEEDVPLPKTQTKKPSQAKRKKQTQCKLSWIGEPIEVFILFLCTLIYVGMINIFPAVANGQL